MFGGFASGKGGQLALPPWLFFPENGQPVDRTSEVATLVAAGTSVPVLSFDIPSKLVLSVRQLGLGALDLSATSSATWAIKLGNDFMAGYHFVAAPIGTINRPADVHIVAQGNQTLEVWVQNNHPSKDWRFFARIAGWVYDPKTVGD